MIDKYKPKYTDKPETIKRKGRDLAGFIQDNMLRAGRALSPEVMRTVDEAVRTMYGDDVGLGQDEQTPDTGGWGIRRKD
jgi:hypothetical protein